MGKDRDSKETAQGYRRVCISCGKILQAACGEDSPVPDDGVIFTSRGNYGSTVWDPVQDDQVLRCFVCDKCMVEKARLIYHFEKICESVDVKTWARKRYERENGLGW